LINAVRFPHQPIAGAMKGLHVQLLLALQLDEPHGWSCGRLGNGFRIAVFVISGPPSIKVISACDIRRRKLDTGEFRDRPLAPTYGCCSEKLWVCELAHMRRWQAHLT
jgi:hypothetical protein